MTEQQRRWDDLMTDHEKRMHHPPMADMFPGMSPEEVVRNVVAMGAAVPGLLDVVYGPPQLDPVTGRPLKFADGTMIRVEKKGLRHQIANGGLKTSLKLSKTQWSAVLAILVATLLRLFGIEIGP